MNQNNMNDLSEEHKLWKDFKKIEDMKEKYLFFNSIPNLPKFIDFIKERENRLNKFKVNLINIQKNRNVPLNFLKESNLIDLFEMNEKIKNISTGYYRRETININRRNILWDSINALKRIDHKFNKIEIKYKLENGIDGGGLKRDWITNVFNEIKKSNVFKPVPNGSCFTLNLYGYNGHIIEFTGKMIALALINRISIPLKLTSSIFKYLLNEKVDLNDMNDFDSEIYQSLKWISENDPSPLMMRFVNSKNEPLCYNGRRIELNDKNKHRFIGLTLFDILLKKYLYSLRILKSGFNKIISCKRVSMYLKSEEIKNCICGTETIDIEDWKKNTIYSDCNSSNVECFFNVISKWPQENLEKLLKFITGSSVVPVDGFEGFQYIGGKIEITVSLDPDHLPIAHTCYNKICLPMINDEKIMENKLLTAIECNCFEID